MGSKIRAKKISNASVLAGGAATIDRLECYNRDSVLDMDKKLLIL
jgi:hypothetical protein